MPEYIGFQQKKAFFLVHLTLKEKGSMYPLPYIRGAKLISLQWPQKLKSILKRAR